MPDPKPMEAVPLAMGAVRLLSVLCEDALSECSGDCLRIQKTNRLKVLSYNKVPTSSGFELTGGVSVGAEWSFNTGFNEHQPMCATRWA